MSGVRGSSPPAWGTQRRRRRAAASRGLIPTCVGNTIPCAYVSSVSWAHPHLRGEHVEQPPYTRRPPGSSPPAWGTLRVPLPHQARRGLIPTCVGNTNPGSVGLRPERAHPHLRGEHYDEWQASKTVWGSSPPAWGTLRMSELLSSQVRLIPTCVGNTMLSVAPSNFVDGSSPPAWGTPPVPAPPPAPRGLIPTCVGNTPIIHGSIPCSQAHPHLRGEHVMSMALTERRAGSSPPAWGTRNSIHGPVESTGLIPTCVGNTSPSDFRYRALRAHPHLRGEHACSLPHGQPTTWLIPTCVGNTGPAAWP